ncbi:leucine-rich repeats and immunoglobulin-like domains protein 2 isoform X1 [Hylaeus anthracinus]|uniref:leucine-rich repeats and immunoglobulin-like domains protein 2 isoform X1 n=2 Tax=Hylaeus anthracinus TaxID=313031 RepID=UPI0023B984D9|nr:leucine-rich repeats and immunoglobulin-like domains protein 2 isoform X1 [Hylaeus anthracinus]
MYIFQKQLTNDKITRTMELLITTLAIVFLASSNVQTWPIDDNYNNNITIHSFDMTIGRNYIVSDSVTRLNLENYGIVYIEEGAFDKVPNLQHLILQGNKIPLADLFSFGQHSTISYLVLSDQVNDHSDNSTILVNNAYPSLQILDLGNTSSTRIQSELRNPFPALKYLDLSNNRIDDVDFIGEHISETLLYLYLNGNELERVALNKFTNLSMLDLEGNEIGTIGDNDGLDLTGLKGLVYLSVANNKIVSIRNYAFRDTVRLENLDMSMNSLSSRDVAGIESLNSLRVLTLDCNLFDDVPAIPVNVISLSMNYNRIKFLKAGEFSKLSNLRTLSLGWNMISEINSNAFGAQEIEDLRLNDNELSHLPYGWHSSLRQLRYLDLSGNKFTLLESAVSTSAAMLETVYFERNPLKYVNSNVFERIFTNATVFLTAERSPPLCKCYR